MSLSILRTGNCLTLTGGGPNLVPMLNDELSYTQKVMYRGKDLRMRTNALAQMQLNNDPRAAHFKPHIDFFKMHTFSVNPTGEVLCPAGMYARIYKILTQNQVPFTFHDRRQRRLPPADYTRLAEAGLIDLRFRQGEVLASIDGNEGGIILAPTGFGKAQPLDSLIQTPDGPVRMGDIQVGDQICGVASNLIKVKAVFPQGEKAVYRITFSDGDSVECCEDHLWEVDSVKLGFQSKVIDTKEVLRLHRSPSGQRNLRIRVPESILMWRRSTLKIAPYIMGVLIGDGGLTMTTPVITSADPELIKIAQQELLPGYELKHSGKYRYALRKIQRNSRSPNEYTHELQRLGLQGHKSPQKFIPREYLYGSIYQRWELLAGLMDTDGTVDKRTGYVSYSTSSSKLAEQFKWLVESLGGVCVIYVKKTKCLPAYICHVRMNNPARCFQLPRKRALVRRRTKYQVRRIISKVEFVGVKPVQCISVSSKDGLYLTDHCVVTHNTYIIKSCCVIYPKSRILICTPGIDTVNGVYKALKEQHPSDVGEVSGRRSQTDKRIIVASVDSLHKVDMNWFDLVLGDECHQYATPSTMQHFSRYTEAKMMGFTASFPCRTDGADLLVEAIFGPPLIDVKYCEAQQGGSVVPIEVLVLDIPPIPGYNNTCDGDAWLRWAYWRNDTRNKVYADFIKSRLSQYVTDPDPQVLCMVDKVEHLMELRQHLPDYTAVYNLPSDTEKWEKRVEAWRRRKMWNDTDPVMSGRLRETYRLAFEAGTLRKAISTHVWKQGVSFDQLSVLARLDGITSEIDSIQLPGRLSRLYDGKLKGVLLDSRDRYDEKADRKSLQRFRSYRSRGWVVREVSPPGSESTLFPT